MKSSSQVHDMIVDGEAMSAVEGKLGYRVPQPSLNRIMAGERAVYAEMAIAIEGATHGRVARYHLRPDLWPECDFEGVDATYLVGSGPHLHGPDRAAADEAVIRSYLDAQHRNHANGSIEHAEALVRARDALLRPLGVTRT